MKIKLNGEELTLDSSVKTISDLLKKKDVKMPDMVSVEYNGDILDRENFENTNLAESDQVEFLYFMGGGF